VEEQVEKQEVAMGGGNLFGEMGGGGGDYAKSHTYYCNPKL
jgi:hypothetical protein